MADNHNNFNLTLFSQATLANSPQVLTILHFKDGQLLSAFESKVKHAQCYDVALIDDSVVLARLAFAHD